MAETLFVKRGDKYVAVGTLVFPEVKALVLPEVGPDDEPESGVFVGQPGSVSPRAPAPSQEAPSQEGNHLDIVEFGLAKRTDGKYQLDLYGTLANGSVSKYPMLKQVGTAEEVFAMIKDVIDPYKGDDGKVELPMRADCIWAALWKPGRETGKVDGEGVPTRYKDLISVRAAF